MPLKIRTLGITGGVAAAVFILSAFYLFVSNAGLGSLISVKAAIFFVLGTFVAGVVIGMSADLLQRSVSRMLWRSITNPISPKSAGRINAVGALAVVVWQVFVTFLFTKLAYEWFTIYFAI
jgi:hypothetical protein